VVGMTGVEILAIEEVAIEFAFNWLACFIGFGVFFAVFILIGFALSVRFDDWSQMIVGLVIGTIMGVIFGIASGFAAQTPTEFENQYKVTISDEVSMNEFLDRYEIVDTEGKIYTVRERD
jgi:hypothetical protein